MGISISLPPLSMPPVVASKFFTVIIKNQFLNVFQFPMQIISTFAFFMEFFILKKEVISSLYSRALHRSVKRVAGSVSATQRMGNTTSKRSQRDRAAGDTVPDLTDRDAFLCNVMYPTPAEPCLFLTKREFINAILY